jgi:pSer/pThr/pTyr-binding forkhead associated (FHA) protein
VKQPVYVQLVALAEGPNIPLDKPIVLIGRHQECDIQIPSRKISRRHCCIAQVNDHLVVRDLGSTNGIRINGIKIIEGNLQAEDELMIGNVRYQLKIGAEPEATRRAHDQHGIKPAKPHNGKRVSSSEESREEPMPLPEMSLSKSVPQGRPAIPSGNEANGIARPLSLEIPEQIDLVPLDPPQK